MATAQIGVLLEDVAPRLKLQLHYSGNLAPKTINAVLRIRLDFAAKNGGYAGSVMFHNGIYNRCRDAVLPWGKGGSVADVTKFQAALQSGRPFEIELQHIAPRNWDGRRLILTLLLQDMGQGASAELKLSKSEWMERLSNYSYATLMSPK